MLRDISANNAAVDVDSWTARLNNSSASDSLLQDEIKSLCQDKVILQIDANSLQLLLTDANIRLQQEKERLHLLMYYQNWLFFI